ncbi:MAG: energy transducer TonB [Pseudomonadota bacterium]
MDTGLVISGVGHAGLLAFVLLGGVFRSEPPAVEVREVSVITSDAFEAMLAAQTPPSQVIEVAQPPVPEAVLPEPAPPAPEVEVTAPTPPAATPEPQPEVVPQPLAPEPEPDVTLETPTPAPPAADVAPVPDFSIRPVPRPAERIAPEAVVEPAPDARPDPVQQEAVTEAETGETEAEAQEATAPEAATTETVTEAEEPAPSAAPTASIRPPSRPVRQAAAPAQSDTDAAVQAAIAAAEAATAPRPAPSGPPLSRGEQDALRVAVSQCWNVGSLSTEALETTVVVAVDMTRDGTPVQGSIRMVSFEGGSRSAAGQAFDAARRAILRCGARGFDLPAEKYDRWREIEMTFNPERMRIR